MPNNHDFETVSNLKETKVSPEGWVNPMVVEYGLGYHGELLSYFWRVKGTKHTFVIPVIRIDFLTEGNYAQHFEEVLESFREDYRGWSEEGWYSEWMQAYRNDYSRHIAI